MKFEISLFSRFREQKLESQAKKGEIKNLTQIKVYGAEASGEPWTLKTRPSARPQGPLGRPGRGENGKRARRKAVLQEKTATKLESGARNHVSRGGTGAVRKPRWRRRGGGEEKAELERPSQEQIWTTCKS